MLQKHELLLVCWFSDTFRLKISDSEMVVERGLPNVTVNHARFHPNCQSIQLYGLINFNHCLFDGNISYIFILRSKYEPYLRFNLRSFKYHVAKWPIKFYKSQFHVRRLTIDPYRVTARELTFIDCEIYTNYFLVRVLSGYNLTLFSLQFHRTVLSVPYVVIEADTETAYIFINMSSLTLSNVALHSVGHFKAYLGLHLENITWVNNNKGFMDLRNVICVNIVSCVLILNCGTCLPVIIDGLSTLADLGGARPARAPPFAWHPSFWWYFGTYCIK